MARVLVIAHRPLLRRVLHRAVAAARHDPLSTCDAMIGLELALTVHPDVVVVAHDGPLLDGAAVVHELREVLREECPRVVLLSTRVHGAGLPSRSGHSTVVLQRPFRIADVWDALGRALPGSAGHPEIELAPDGARRAGRRPERRKGLDQASPFPSSWTLARGERDPGSRRATLRVCLVL